MDSVDASARRERRIGSEGRCSVLALLGIALALPELGWADGYRVTGVGRHHVAEFETVHLAKAEALLAAKQATLEQLRALFRSRPELGQGNLRDDDLRAVLLGLVEFEAPVTEMTVEGAGVQVRVEAAGRVEAGAVAAGLARVAGQAEARAIVLRAWQDRSEAAQLVAKAQAAVPAILSAAEAQAASLHRETLAARASALELVSKAWLAGDKPTAMGGWFRDPSAARQAVDLALQVDPACGTAYLTRGYLRLEERNLRAAAADFTAALRHRSDDALAQVGLGHALHRLGQRDKAIEAFRLGLRQQRDDLKARLALATLLREKGDLSSAEVEYRALLAKAPGDAEAHAGLGQVYARTGDLKAAVESFREGMRLRADDAALRFSLGMALGRQGDIDGAIVEQRQAVRLNPRDPEYRHHLGYLLALNGQLDEALAEYQAGLHLAPNDVPLYVKVGDLLQKKGDGEGARKSYHKAVALKPTEPFAHWGLAEVFAATGRLKDAAREYRQFLKFAEDTPATRAKIQLAQAKVAQLEAR